VYVLRAGVLSRHLDGLFDDFQPDSYLDGYHVPCCFVSLFARATSKPCSAMRMSGAGITSHTLEVGLIQMYPFGRNEYVARFGLRVAQLRELAQTLH
jgi:hypothetical protein